MLPEETAKLLACFQKSVILSPRPECLDNIPFVKELIEDDGPDPSEAVTAVRYVKAFFETSQWIRSALLGDNLINDEPVTLYWYTFDTVAMSGLTARLTLSNGMSTMSVNQFSVENECVEFGYSLSVRKDDSITVVLDDHTVKSYSCLDNVDGCAGFTASISYDLLTGI